MLAGPADHTFCYYGHLAPSVTTHAAQLAKPVLFFSPWQFLFWYDQPKTAQDEPELEFFKHLPTTWDDTRVLHGKVGHYAAIARRSGENWFIGTLNAGEPRTLDLALGFLPAGKRYEAITYRHDPAMQTRTKVAIERRTVDSTTILKARMSDRDGVAIRLVPIQGK